MCGIVGVVGNPNATKILINGLKKLEYRGYDSAGIYVNDLDGHDYLVKEVGKIKNLENKITDEVKGSTGIGHTRWATHGIPTVENAHPHYSINDRFYLVHNGVIENFDELKNEYLGDVQFASTTDTEIVVQLINYFAEAENLDTFAAFKRALSVVKGSYAFGLIDALNPEHLYIAKNKSPLLIGKGNGFNMITSDASAMIDQTQEFIEIHDGEIGDLTKDSIYLEKNGQEVTRDSYHVNPDENEISKNGFDHFMMKEIFDQPIVYRNIIENYFDNDQIKVDQDLINKMLEADRIYILAAGTSYNAGLVGKELFETIAQIPTEVAIASEFGHHFPILSKKPFFIFLSQSGETADSRQVLVELHKKNLPSLTITNSPNSTLAREADYALNLYAGKEVAVASTKAYTAQIAVEAILAKKLGEEKRVPAAADFDVKEDLSIIAAKTDEMLGDKDIFNQMTKDYLKNTRNAFYIGRGIDYDLVLEAALKLKEVSYIQTEGFAAAELKHGTIALIEEDTPVIAIINDPITADLTRGNIQEVKARGAKVFTIVNESLATDTDNYIVPDVNYLLSPLLSVVPVQLIAYFASLNRGYDVDQPRNLAKSVTVE